MSEQAFEDLLIINKLENLIFLKPLYLVIFAKVYGLA